MTLAHFGLTLLASFLGTLAAAGVIVQVVRRLDDRQGTPHV